MESEKTKLLNLEKDLKARVKGQDEAIEAVNNAVLRGRAGINDPNRPIGSFLFMGPTGVGTTELAKALAYSLFDSEKAMIRFDMSEFMEKHSVSKLVGAPPGYVGYEQAGELTEAVRRRPYSVILLDEIEKAHPDVLNLFLQVLDDGQLRDSQGHEVNFKNTIIIMTTNLNAELIMEGKKVQALKDLTKYMKKEFINRIDEIVEKLLNDLHKRLEKEDLQISFDKSLDKWVQKSSYDPAFGARPIKRFIQKEIENFLAEKIVTGQVNKNKKYLVSVKDDKVVLKEQKAN